MTKKWVCKQIIKICICSIREQCCQAQQQHSYFVYLGATVISTCSHYSSVHFGLKYVYKKNLQIIEKCWLEDSSRTQILNVNRPSNHPSIAKTRPHVKQARLPTKTAVPLGPSY